MKKTEINGFFDDDGNKINPLPFRKPQLCLSCKKNDDPCEVRYCNMIRLVQRNENEFICYDYESTFIKVPFKP